jgi:hypothetical protein
MWQLPRGQEELMLTLQVIGALCVVIALIGGGVKISSVEVPKLSNRRIIALLIAGILLIAAGLLVHGSSGASASPRPGSEASLTRSSQP